MKKRKKIYIGYNITCYSSKMFLTRVNGGWSPGFKSGITHLRYFALSFTKVGSFCPKTCTSSKNRDQSITWITPFPR